MCAKNVRQKYAPKICAKNVRQRYAPKICVRPIVRPIVRRIVRRIFAESGAWQGNLAPLRAFYKVWGAA